MAINKPDLIDLFKIQPLRSANVKKINYTRVIIQDYHIERMS